MSVRVVLPFAVVLLMAADDPAKDAKKEKDRLQGEWTMVSMETRGAKHSKDDVKKYKLTIKGDKWTVMNGLSTGPGRTFKIDPSKDPKTLDLTIKVGDKEKVSQGIYKLEGDTLTVCRPEDNGERPKEFKTTVEAGILVVWKRAKK
jgi:uncharacterized protein (TIGR03067 family)